MACVLGTNIVNDGLVFHFDLENGVKSWRGKPTSNLIAGSVLTSWSGTGSRVADTTVLSETYDGGTIYHLEDATGVNPNVEVDNYYMYNSYSPVAAGEQYTFSMDVKVLQKSNSAKVGASNCFWIWYAQSTEYVYFSDLPLNEWTRVHVTCTVGSTYNYIIPRIDYDNTILEIANLQLEADNIATKYINGIRLDTASIIDLSPNKNTITAANLTYRQDDTPTFDGTDDYLETSLANYSNNEISIDAWFKLFHASGTNTIIGRGALNTDDEIDLIFGYSDPFRLVGRFAGAGSQTSYPWSSENDNIWKNSVMTVKDIGSNRVNSLYIDGVLVDSVTTSRLISSYSGQFDIGRLPLSGRYFSGEISQVKIYNKALTAQEVKQNFEAVRTRYGI